jgi:hypothetical protein
VIKSDARCAREIKSRIAMEKVAFNKKTLFTSKLDLISRKKLVNCYIWSIDFMALNLDPSEIRSDIIGEFKNVGLEKNGDQLD